MKEAIDPQLIADIATAAGLGFRNVDKELVNIAICGSQYTRSSPPPDSDTDYLIEIKNGLGVETAVASTSQISAVTNLLGERGFKMEGKGEHYQDSLAKGFLSFRRGNLNLIVTGNPDFARRHRVATHICRTFDIADKNLRIAIFQGVLYNNAWEPSAPLAAKMVEPFSRSECIFNYCPHPSDCKEKCQCPVSS